jgi:sugar phosphate isomerase/epimerase
MALRISIETGILAADIRDFGEAEVRRAAELGFDGVACQFGARFPAAHPRETTTAECERVRALLDRYGLGIAYSWSYWGSLIHREEEKRREGVAIAAGALRVAHDLGAPCVTMGPGSNDPTHAWYPHPENGRPASLGRLIRSLIELVPVADELGVTIALKGHAISTLDTPEKFALVIGAVDSPWVRAAADPVNLMRLEHVYDSAAFARHLVDVLGEHVVVAQAKDFVLEEDLVTRIAERPPGSGWMDYEAFLRAYAERCPDGWIGVEHVPIEQIAAAREHLASIVADLGSVPGHT